jgi:hypothetical protein
MLTNITYITPNINKQTWEIGEEIGHAFEEYIYKVLVKCLNATFSKDINIQQTETTRDGGKDIIIDTSKDLNLFGVPITLKGKDKVRIYIECKSSNYDTILYEKFAKNAILAGQDNVDYLVLVTNKTITPFSYYSTDQLTKNYNCEFILIDQYILATYLKSHNLDKWNYEDPAFDNSTLALCYQVSKGSYYRKPSFELYILCRNYLDKLTECEVELLTDRNWKISGDKVQFVLDTNKSKCLKLIISREYFDGLDDILLHLSFNNNRNIIRLEGNSLSYNFELPLTGTMHKEIIRDIEETVLHASTFTWINLYGEAGIGKTRIIEELSRGFWQNNVRTLFFTCENSKKQSTFDSLLGYINKNSVKKIVATNIKDLFFQLYDKLLWTVVVVEDIHNADESFLKMLQEFLKETTVDATILFITAGRDDYTVYNESYYSFLETLKISNPSYMHNYQVTALTDSECKNLIKRIITDIPLVALERIHGASKNNPFFLVQFIEYLLETKMVNLLNRNTVGIPNIHTFSEKIYIPKGVEDIIEKRYKVLEQFSSGTKLRSFLIAAALYGIHFPKKLLFAYFSESEYTSTETLFTNHFFKYVDNETLQFDHETLYLFIKNRKLRKKDELEIAQYIYSNMELFQLYPELKQGIILYKVKEYIGAKKKLLKPIQEIAAMDNVSSENVSSHYYEYFEYIYNIAKQDKDKAFMKKVIQAKVYVAMHNLAIGQAQQAFEEAFILIEKNHITDEKLYLEIKQLQASYFLHIGMVSRARGIMLDLLAIERTTSNLFDDNIRFNLFERAASLYIHSNHISPAIEYNRLAYKVADDMDNDKLRALAKINEAKLWFFSDIDKSYNIMQEAKSYLAKKNVPRIDCHNDLGLLTAEMVLTKCNESVIKTQILRAKELLEKSIEINYPLDIIRSHFLLAVLYFLGKDKALAKSKKHIEAGIDASVRYGILKLVGNFYNLKALIAIEEKQNNDYIMSLYDTMIDYLKQEDLLFLGNLDFTYSNIILLTNYLIFLNEHDLESKNYQFLSQITYYGSDIKCDFNCNAHSRCHYTCINNTKVFQNNFRKIKEGSLLLVSPQYKFALKDKLYFIPIYL